VFERFHLPALERVHEAALVALCEPDPARRRWASARLPGLPVTPNFDELRAAAPADAMFILTPPATHRELAVRGADAGLHLLVEKPMALAVRDARAMTAAAARAGRHLQVGFNRRFRLPYQAFRQALRTPGAPTVGSLRYELTVPAGAWGAHAGFLGDDALGGGALDDVLSHAVDLIGWIFGDWPAEVVGAARLGADRVACELRLSRAGPTVTCIAGHGPYLEYLEAEDADGIWVVSGARLRRTTRRGGRAWRVRRARVDDRIALALGKALRRQSATVESFAAQIRDFVAAARAGVGTGANGDDGLRTVATIEACRRALAHGGSETVSSCETVG
jgi:predicted dehydrogenase